MKLIAATEELNALAMDPKESLRYISRNVSTTTISKEHHQTPQKTADSLSLHAVYAFKMADAVPLTGSASCQEVSRNVHSLTGTYVSPVNIRRFIQHATNGLLCEPKSGFVAHSSISRLLNETVDPQLNAWRGAMTEGLFPAVADVVGAMRKWPGSEQPFETGVNFAYNQQLPWFDFLQTDPASLKRYNLAMQSAGSREGLSITHTVTGYTWEI
jgi:hypothetical protein